MISINIKKPPQRIGYEGFRYDKIVFDGAPTKTRTRIGRLGGNCSILLSYRRTME